MRIVRIYIHTSSPYPVIEIEALSPLFCPPSTPFDANLPPTFGTNSQRHKTPNGQH